MRIKRVVELLVRKYGTRDPIKIASLMGIKIEYRNLKGIWGYFQMYLRIPVIHIAYNLPENLILFVIAHELAHRILHPGINVPFLRANTLQSVDKIERQANQFAVELLIPDKLITEGASIYDAASVCGVPEEVAHLKSEVVHKCI
ncbi:ImmA/IrrE family metallo-endopeptidase [Paenibacillus sp. TAB 01]|uniref:ImmA/IrrE family metallo-endopeptidase n=1 Tax=Paenibacillus sp. TAB 01 TaxID=3368988 RepID=UPI003751801C